jgi:hypothetical protein
MPLVRAERPRLQARRSEAAPWRFAACLGINVKGIAATLFAIERGDPDFLAYLNAWIAFHEDTGWLERRRSHWFRSLDWMPKP